MDLLGLFANQAAIALDLLQKGRRARAAVEGDEGQLAVVARIAAELDALTEGRRDDALALLTALERVLRAKTEPGRLTAPAPTAPARCDLQLTTWPSLALLVQLDVVVAAAVVLELRPRSRALTGFFL